MSLYNLCSKYHKIIRLLFVLRSVLLHIYPGQDSEVGIAAFYGLDGWAIRSWWRARFFLTLPYRPWGLSRLLQRTLGLFPGIKATGVWLWPPTPSNAKVKGSVE
jgi:hypothetical protein